MGFGYATVLIQFHLGVGLVILVLASAVSSIPALQKQLGGGLWEAGLKAAAAAAGPAPLLAVFALIQASGARSDLLTWAGLLAATSAVMLGALHPVLCCCFGLDLPAINGRTGDISPSSPEEVPLAKSFSVVARLLSSLRAFGEALLTVASLPTGMQFLCATALLRLTLGHHAVSGAANALALGGTAGLRRDVEKVTAVAPIIGSLALMDGIVFGPGSVLLAPVLPVLYCALIVLAQVVMILAVRTRLHGGVVESEYAEFDFRFYFGNSKAGSEIGLLFERFRFLTVAGLHAALAVGVARVLAGTITIRASTSAFTAEWGEPLFTTAGLLAALLIMIHVFEMVLAGMGNTDSCAPAVYMNGCDGPATDSPHAIPEKPTATTTLMKAIAMPLHSLILGLMVAHMQVNTSSESGAPFSVMSMPVPLQYGFIIAALAIGMQIALLVMFVLVRCDGAEPPLDGTGTLHWQSEGKALSSTMAHLRQATLLSLQGGLIVGWVGMGIRLWVVLGLTLGPMTYLSLPTEVRKTFREILYALSGSAKGVVDYLSSCMEAYLKQKQYEKEVLHARKADEMAAQVERELGTAPGEAKGVNKNAPKGLKGSKTPAPAEAKVGKAKGASKPRRR